MRSTISTITEESQETQEDIVVEMEKSSPEEKEDEQQSFGALPTPTTSKNNPGFDALHTPTTSKNNSVKRAKKSLLRNTL